MARGTQFLEIITRVKSVTGRSNIISVGVDDLPRIKEQINTVYSALYADYDWPHLRKVFDRITLNSGQRYYDFPTGLNSERVEKAVAWWSGIAHDIDRGIGYDEYSVYDSEDDERSEPVLNWDVRWTGTVDQIEIWPIPNTNTQELQFTGIQALPRLVNDADRCLLDDTLVTQFAAADLTKDKDESEKMRKLAIGHLSTLKARTKTTVQGVRLGLTEYEDKKPQGIVVRVR